MGARFNAVMAVLVLAGCGSPAPHDVAVGDGDAALAAAGERATPDALESPDERATPDAFDSPDARANRGALFESRVDSGTIATFIDGDAARAMRAPGDHAFFRSFGTNGRACVHCHVPSAGWSLTPEVAQLRFTNPLDAGDPACLADPYRCRAEPDPRRWGRDPLFRAVDGAVSPTADVRTTAARLAAYRLLLEKGLIRVGMGVPAGAEFTLDAVDDPYRHASSAELSLFRRPLPATNLRTGDAAGVETLSAIMWDGREPSFDHQANDATLGHAEAARSLDAASQRAIVDFETHLHTAQLVDRHAGDLTRFGGRGGPRALAGQQFYAGINDVFAGDARSGAAFSSDVFSLYDAWRLSRNPAQAAVARGQAIFNRKSFVIRGVRGVNDAVGQDAITGTCSTCHDSPNYGHHSLPLALDLGLSDGARRTADLPLYTLRNKTTGERLQTTDPGRALVTGKWRDIGKFKGPILRAVAARAPYFHNGSAASLTDVVEFYDGRFTIGLSDGEKRDLVAFLRTL